MRPEISWADIKALFDSNQVLLKYLETKDAYRIFGYDGMFSVECFLNKSRNAEEVFEFETIYKAQASKPLAPRDPSLGRVIYSTSAFAVNTDYEVKAAGFNGIAAHATTDESNNLVPTVTDIDFAVGGEDRYINGIELIVGSEAVIAKDVIDFMVADVAGVLPLPYREAFPNYPVLKQFGFSWNVSPASPRMVVFNYLARLQAGFYVRLRYTSHGAVDVPVACNLLLHKKVA